MSPLEGFLCIGGVEATSPGWWGLKEWVCACGREEIKRDDLTKDENLGKGIPAFWVLEKRGCRRSAEVCLPSVSVPVHQR